MLYLSLVTALLAVVAAWFGAKIEDRRRARRIFVVAVALLAIALGLATWGAL